MRANGMLGACRRGSMTDWVIDLGPGGGVNGGKIVVEGTPERIAQEPTSATGQYLKPLLARSSRAKSRDAGIDLVKEMAAE